MTFTELRYVVAVARERHFGRAAQACHISQPSLSVAVKKFEEELGIRIFERQSGQVTVTPAGQGIVEQAQRVLEEVARLHEFASQGRDALCGPLRVGVIYTVAPWLLPPLVARMQAFKPQMPLILSEDYTAGLVAALKDGRLDCIITATSCGEAGVDSRLLYEEKFVAEVPARHPLAALSTVTRRDLKDTHMLLLGSGHCFRDQILEYMGESGGESQARRTMEGSSLQTLSHMVAQNLGITVLPASSAPYVSADPLVRLVAFREPWVPKRQVSISWRRTFPRAGAIDALCEGIWSVPLTGCEPITTC